MSSRSKPPRRAPRSYGRDPGDAEYAARLLRSARDLYSAANAHPGSFAARYHYQCTSRFNRARLGARNVARLAANATCVPPAQARRAAPAPPPLRRRAQGVVPSGCEPCACGLQLAGWCDKLVQSLAWGAGRGSRVARAG
jgi:hypothetical protein